jgi:hypothetical protein
MRLIDFVGWPAVVLALGSLFSMAGALMAARQQAKSAEQRGGLERQLKEKADENAKLSREIAASVTGGDTFAYLLPAPGLGSKDSIALLLNRDGDYPLYDVEIRISDQAKVDEFMRRHFDSSGTAKPGFSLKAFFEGQAILKVGNVGINQGWVYDGFRLPNPEHFDLGIFIQARNGSVSQRLAMRRINGELKWASIVRRDRDNALLVRSVDPGFPVDSAGNIQW